MPRRPLVPLTLALMLLAACAGPVHTVNHARSAAAPVTPAAAAAGDDAGAEADPVAAQASERPPQPTQLPVPVRVALAFAPESNAPRGPTPATLWGNTASSWSTGPLPEAFKALVLEQMAGAFRGQPVVGDIEIVPSFYLSGATAPELVASVRATFDVDVVALVSYDLQHFQRENGWAFLYLALLPMVVVPGSEVDSQLLLDTAVYWADNAALLFRAAGTSTGHDTFAMVYRDEHVQAVTEDCFARAREELVPRLQQELAEFAARTVGVPRGR
jgi:rhombotail lipoprotein